MGNTFRLPRHVNGLRIVSGHAKMDKKERRFTMADMRALGDDQMDAVSGGSQISPEGEKKDLIKALYESSTQLEIAAEKGIDKLMQPVMDLLRQNGK
jgi:hypothetical protein